MPLIETRIDDLRHRGENVRQLLQPISKRPGGPAWKQIFTISEYIIGTHDGAPPRSNYRDWRFPTVLPNFRGMYFELWRRSEHKGKEFWYLFQAYLSIYQIDRRMQTETELLCLHCDPNEPDNAPHAIYKQGPHLHINVAVDPIPHAHIALNRGHLKEVLSSVNDLTKALGLAVQMLREEIFDIMKFV